MQQILVKYHVTCTSDRTLDEMITKFDPLLLAEINLALTSKTGDSCCLTVEDVELVAAEKINDEDDG